MTTTTHLPTSDPLPVPASVRRRLVYMLFAGQSLFSAAQIITFGILPIVVVQLGRSDAVAGLPATVTLIGRAVAAYPVGWLMDKVGRRFGLSLGFLLCTIGTVLSALAIGWESLFGLLLGVLIAGMGRGIGEQARFAAAEVETSDRRAKAIGLVVFAGTIGAVVGPRLLAPAEQLAIRFGIMGEMGPFLVGAFLFYLAFMVTALFLRPDPMLVGRALEAELPKPVDDVPEDARPLRTIFADWNVRLSLISMTVGQLVMTTIMVITPLHMAKLTYTTDDIGWVLMAHTLGMFGLAGLTGWLIDRTSATLMIGVGGLVLILAAILTPLASNLWLLSASLFLLGLGWNFCFVAGSTLLSAALKPVERGRVQGASETMISLASGIGSLSVGALFTYGGIVGISAGGLLFSLVLLVAMLWIVRQRPNAVALSGD
ncbi:MAG: MFS transporter [Caldilineaceae bacterium]|nr:MFS transporter [Caldilineaceae bacterium]